MGVISTGWQSATQQDLPPTELEILSITTAATNADIEFTCPDSHGLVRAQRKIGEGGAVSSSEPVNWNDGSGQYFLNVAGLTPSATYMWRLQATDTGSFA